jgi:hypothetical protein
MDLISKLTRITVFNNANLLIGLGNLMICTHNLAALTKTKETMRYCKSFGYGGKMLLTHVSINLTELVYLQKINKLCP